MRNNYVSETLKTFFSILESPVRCSKRCECYYLQDQLANVFNCSNSRIKLGYLKLSKETNWLVADSNRIPKLCLKFSLKNITYINLHSSRIALICDEFWDQILINKQLYHLNLANNSVRHVSQSLKDLIFLRKIYLGENPIECTCDALWFSDWLVNFTTQSGERIIQDFKDVRCLGGKWDGIPVYKLDPIAMQCYSVFTK